jgi:hypothetical protein
MALEVKVKSNVKNLQARYIKFAHKFPRIITMGLEQSGQFLKTAILHRTDRGQDINRNTFVAYSSAYAEEKGKSRVDLQDSNDMLNSIDSRVAGRNKVQIYFRSGKEATKAFWHQTGAGNLPVRKFFGYDKKLENVIQRNFATFVKKQIRRLGL